jgi:serine/threonine protein kinase
MQPPGLVGTVLNGVYRLARPIASGGAGEIYEAVDLRQPGKRYAIKVLHAAHNPVALQRFQREATITSELGHDHIIEVYDFAVAENGMPYLVMELLEGEDLARRLARSAPMALDVVVRLTQQIALGLDAAHREGVVHRDLKPQNIFLCRRPDGSDFVKLLDFGVSKVRDSSSITGDNMITGTPSYMSPEQAEGHLDDVDHRTDIFALGVVVWEMLTGRRAFEAPTIAGTLYQVVFTKLDLVHTTRPEVPSRVDVIIRTAVAKAKRSRYGSALLFAAQLADAATRADRPSATVTHASSPPPTTLDIPAIAAKPKRILFVDDSPTMRTLVPTWLTGAGYEVEVASDGDEGVEKIKQRAPDLVIADVNMPKLDGFALCRAIKDDPATRAIPVILFTRLNEATDIVSGLAAGADAFVIKGTGANDLLRQVENLLPDAPDPSRRKTAALASMQDRLGPTLGRKAIFKRLFHALFREVPFDILALLGDGGSGKKILLLGSHHELAPAVADEIIGKLVSGYAELSGQPLSVAELDAQLIVIDETALWGHGAADLKRSVMVPILLGDEMIGCLGVFSFENHPALDANIRFFFDIGVAAAHALRGLPPPG